MGAKEISVALGVSQALVSQLAKRGMPLTTPQAANAWRAVHAPPRQWKSKAGKSSSPITASKPIKPIKPIKPRQSSSSSSSAPTASIAAPTEEADGPRESLRRAKAAERASYQHLVESQKDKNSSAEDLRKSSSVYFASRSNRQRAEADHREFLRADSITLFYEEAQAIASRPHLAAANSLAGMAKSLAPRLAGMSQKSIEKTLNEWADKLTAILRQAI